MGIMDGRGGEVGRQTDRYRDIKERANILGNRKKVLLTSVMKHENLSLNFFRDILRLT